MKTALSLVAALALGCASTAALAQQNQSGSQYDPQYNSQNSQLNDQDYNQTGQQYGNQSGQYGSYSQPDQYGQSNDNDQGYDQNNRYNQGMNENGYDRSSDRDSSMHEGSMVSIDRGDVRMIQLKLQRDGYDPGTADGYWGQQTADALADFQRANGIAATGNLNLKTIRALGIRPGQGYGGYNNGTNFSNGSNSGYNNNDEYNQNNDDNQNEYNPHNGMSGPK